MEGLKALEKFKHSNHNSARSYVAIMKQSIYRPGWKSKLPKWKIQKVELRHYEQIKSRRDDKCKYCPHVDSCPDGFIEKDNSR